jgi:hypothetical protein
MKCLRVYADESGESHFSEMEIAMSESPARPGRTMSTPAAAVHIQFLTVSSKLYADWHPAPARQFVISLDSTIEIETSDGERRKVLPPSVVFVEDTWGKGHKTRSLDDHAGTIIFVPLAADPAHFLERHSNFAPVRSPLGRTNAGVHLRHVSPPDLSYSEMAVTTNRDAPAPGRSAVRRQPATQPP